MARPANERYRCPRTISGAEVRCSLDTGCGNIWDVESLTGTLVVRRPPRRGRDAETSYRIEVNGTARGLLAPGQTLVWHLPSGTYRVRARIDRTGSPPIDVDIGEGSTVWLAVVPQGWRQQVFQGRGASGFLALREVKADGGWVPATSDGTDLFGLSPERAAEAAEAATREPVLDVSVGRWLHQMMSSRVSAVAWVCALIVTGAGGLVLAADYVVALLSPVRAAAGVAFLAGLLSFGVLGFVEARLTGAGFWSAIWKALRAFFSALRHLFP